MKILVFLSLLAFHNAAAATHSLKYFYTASSGIPNFPEFVTLGMVNGHPISYYDSFIEKESPRQDWMAETEGPEYWEKQTQISLVAERSFRDSIGIVKQRLNQTEGVHIVQKMYGCEWNDETGEVNGFNQFGYDGEDFIVFNLETKTWVAPKQQALMTKMKWDRDKDKFEIDKNYLTQDCVDWLKTYMNYGRSSFLRTDLPSVSLLQKTPSSPVSCHATGFYPDRVMMFWRKDGEEIHEGVEHGETLPNHDGSFQMSVELDVTSVTPEDWRRYDCVFQLSGVKHDIITKLEKAVIRTNWEKPPVDMTIPIIVAVVVLGLVLISAIGFMLYKKKQDKCPPPPSDNSSELSEKLNPEA